MSTWRKWLQTFLPRVGTARESSSGSPYPLPPQLLPTNHFPHDSISRQARFLVPDQLYPLLPIKTWTSRHISPYAWDRAIIRSLPALQRIQAHLPSLLAPRSDTQVPGKAIEVILNSLKDMYGISINPEEVLQRTVL